MQTNEHKHKIMKIQNSLHKPNKNKSEQIHRITNKYTLTRSQLLAQNTKQQQQQKQNINKINIYTYI